MPTFAELTTMRLGGPATDYLMVSSAEELIGAVSAADRAGRPVLVIGGGSNIVVGDQGFDGLVAHVQTSGLTVDGETIHVDAGVEWDHVVRVAIEHGLGGLEPLSGIPGSAGGTPVQNVGAYGASVSQFLDHVVAFDRRSGEVVTIPNEDCGFGRHRTSIFKRNDRWVILSIQLTLASTTTSHPIAYAALAERLDASVGDHAPVEVVRDAVLAMRRERGMVLDEDDHDTWSVGSFFLNALVETVPERARECPSYPDVGGTKLPAAWLINHAGFPRGYGADWGSGRVRLSTRHALAITNRGGATTAEVMAFAAHIRDGVERTFDIRLEPECDLVNCTLGG